MNKKTAAEIKKIIKFVEEQNKSLFYLTWQEEGYIISLQKKIKSEDTMVESISSETGDYIVENIRSLDNSFKIQDLLNELESEGIY